MALVLAAPWTSRAELAVGYCTLLADMAAAWKLRDDNGDPGWPGLSFEPVRESRKPVILSAGKLSGCRADQNRDSPCL